MFYEKQSVRKRLNLSMRPMSRKKRDVGFPASPVKAPGLSQVLRATSADKFSTREYYARIIHKSTLKQKLESIRLLPADVHCRATFRVFFCLAQHLVRDRSGVTLAESDVLEQV